MTRTSLRTTLADIFATELNVEVPSPDTDLLETGRLDSLSFVELILQLERRLGIQVKMEELEVDQFRSLTSIAQFVAARSRRRSRETAVG